MTDAAQSVPEEARKAAIYEVSKLRAAQSGGCFRPPSVPDDGDCADGDCYCYRACEREVDAVIQALTSADAGMVAVPVEPTRQQITLGDQAWVMQPNTAATACLEHIYRAMISPYRIEDGRLQRSHPPERREAGLENANALGTTAAISSKPAIHWHLRLRNKTQCGIPSYPSQNVSSEADTVSGNRIEITEIERDVTCQRCRKTMRISPYRKDQP